MVFTFFTRPTAFNSALDLLKKIIKDRLKIFKFKCHYRPNGQLVSESIDIFIYVQIVQIYRLICDYLSKFSFFKGAVKFFIKYSYQLIKFKYFF